MEGARDGGGAADGNVMVAVVLEPRALAPTAVLLSAVFDEEGAVSHGGVAPLVVTLARAL